MLAVPTTIVVAAVRVGNTGKSDEAPLVDKPAWVYRQPKVRALTGGDRAVVLETMTRFVQTAVARKNLDSAWPLLGPALRAGMTRKEWDSGFNTVVPYRSLGIAALDTLYTYDGDVAFDVSLLGAKSEDAIAKTFTIELTRDPKRPSRWLVASWVPKGVSSPEVSRSERRKPQLPAEVTAPTSSRWLFIVPLAVLSLALLVPLVVGIRSFVANRRAARRYEQELAAYRSTSSPS